MNRDRAGDGHPGYGALSGLAEASPCPGAQPSSPATADATQAATQGTQAATQGIVRHAFEATRVNNMALISQKSSRNMELQLLLVHVIQTYEAEQKQAKAAGLTVSQHAQHIAEQAKKKRKVVEGDLMEEISPTEMLRPGQLTYTRWTKALFQRALMYIDIDAMPPEFVKHLSIEVCKELFEFGLGLRMHGDNPDKATNTNLLKLFGMLKNFYEMHGSLWATRIQWDGGNPLWASCGFYTVEKHMGRIFVKCSLVRDPVEFTKDICGSDPGPFDVVSQNFSLKLAHFKTAKDSYVLMNLFPVLSAGRMLRRRLSEQLGVATPDVDDAAASVQRPAAASSQHVHHQQQQQQQQ